MLFLHLMWGWEQQKINAKFLYSIEWERMKREHEKKWFFIVYFITNSKAIFYAKKVMSGKYVLSFYWCSAFAFFIHERKIIYNRSKCVCLGWWKCTYWIRKLNIWLRNFHSVLFFGREEFMMYGENSYDEMLLQLFGWLFFDERKL